MTWNVVRAALLAVGIGVILGDEAAAQRRGLVDVSPDHYRRGLWMDFGMGYGEESYKFGNDPYTESLGKPTFVARIGGTPNPHLRLGFEGTVWVNSYQAQDLEGFYYNTTETLWSAMLIGRVYPFRDLGLFAKAGAGLGVTAVSIEYGDGTSESGFGTTLGAGYEIRLTKNLFLTPAVDWYHSSYTSRVDDTLHERLLNFNVVLTIQPGR